MDVSLELARVGPGQLNEATRLLCSSTGQVGQAGLRQAAALAEQIRARPPESYVLWWVRQKRDGRALAAALVLQTPGRAGLLFFSEPEQTGLAAELLGRLVRTVTREALAGGAAFVQALPRPDVEGELDVLEAAGYRKLARLSQMQLDLQGQIVQDRTDSGLEWIGYQQAQQQRWGDLILQTYQQGLDCPGLQEVRSGLDILASHQAAGVFRPENWWILRRDGRDVGCLLVNGLPGCDDRELIYLGLVADCRGQGLSRVLLRRAIADAARAGAQQLRLAVDTLNVPAIKLYQRAGFVRTHGRDIYFFA